MPVENFSFTLPDCPKKGDYPKSYKESGLIKIIHDKLIELNGNCKELHLIRKYYDIILTIQIQAQNKNLSQEYLELIKKHKNIDNLIAHLFLMIRNHMLQLKIRDDLILSNDHLHRTHLKKIKFFLSFYNK